MSNNYRCDEGIIDFVNELFGNAFTLSGESIGYTDADKLNFKKVYPDEIKPPYCPVEINISLKNADTSKEEKIDTAPDLLAKKIKELISVGTLADGTPIKPSDIAVIIRKRSKIPDYVNALAKEGVLSDSKDDRNFFLNSEILLALCLLNAIDNPKKDIYLAGLMCSPLYGFSFDELLAVRKSSRATYLYDALTEYSKNNPTDKKTADFLHALYHYRAIAEGMGVDKLIARLYRETGLLALASRNGGKDNLLLLYNYARKYESSSFMGLYNFITYINNVIDRDTSFAKLEEDVGEDAVKILTIHSSKGLEFPVVFLVDASAPLINLDTQSRVAYAEDFGISVCLNDPSGLALVNNPVQEIVRDYMNSKFFEEELRVLYVALTRAKEKLYIYGKTTETDADEFLEKTSFAKSNLSPFSQRLSKSYLDIIMSCQSGARIRFAEEEYQKAESDEGEEPSKSECEQGERASIDEEKKAELLKKFNFKYPKGELTEIPEKLSVSVLHPAVLDGSDDNAVIEQKAEEASDQKKILPAFISGVPSDESAKKGIATHTFLQFCDFDALVKNGVESELSRLIKNGFISEENGARVRKNELEAFARSELFQKIRGAKKLYREFRFNSRLPAERFTKDENKKGAYEGVELLVQGVIDCILEDENGEIHLIDYKTDRLSKEELCDRGAAEKTLREKHSLQLSYYALAAEKIFGKRPKSVCIYSLALGDSIDVDC